MLSIKQIRSYAAAIQEIVGHHVKSGGVAEKSFAFSGILYLSRSGWLLLSVPNSLVRGAFDALHEHGLELPLNSEGRLNAHITVMSPDEVEEIGGPEAITERGHQFSYSLGPLKTVEPHAWRGVSRVWYITADSPALRDLRRSYGLPALRKGFDHHITVAVRKVNTKVGESAATMEPLPSPRLMAALPVATERGMYVPVSPPSRLFTEAVEPQAQTNLFNVDQRPPTQTQLQKDLAFAPTAMAARANFQERLRQILAGGSGDGRAATS